MSYIFLMSGVYRMEVQSSGYDGNLVSQELLSSGANNLRVQEQHHIDTMTGCKTVPSLWKLVPSIAINVF